MKLSAVVVTQNEENNIVRCLESLLFADEILVVDALSEDRTVELARELGARVLSRTWDGFSSQKQFAIDQAKGEWILLVDADEEVSNELCEEIRAVIQTSDETTTVRPPVSDSSGKHPPLHANDPRVVGFKIRRKNHFLGRWMERGPWADDYQIRLFKNARGVIAKRPVHEGVQLDGDSGILQNPLHHYTHQTLSESFRRLNRYTTLEATERASRRTIGLFDVVFPPVGVFLRYYVAGGCWKNGVRGFLLSAITSMYKSVLYLKIFMLQRQKRVDGNL
ncbi:MAG: glycosyltransferase family 2 protein [Candidatus Latescibacterota bacterium]|nr:MAG: glycosyltransferase family 2 protein [Candidatus Latescibacterota bacterium]